MDNTANKQGASGNSLSELILRIFKRKWLIVIITAICVLAAVFYNLFIQQPHYVSSAKIVILNTTDTGGLTSSEIALSSYLVADYAELIVDKTVLEEVGKELSPKMSYDQLKATVSINVPESSRIIEIKVSTSNPESSKIIADKICEVARVKLFNLYGVDKVNQFAPASYPHYDSSPSLFRITFLGLIVGLFIGVVLVLFTSYMDDRIETEDDIMNTLGLCTLARIPYHSKKAAKKPKKKGDE